MIPLGDPVSAATSLVGATLVGRGVTLRVVEVEAYGGPPDGPWPDPAAHSYRGPTPRNRVMFGSAGQLYVYLSYGMHMCANVVCGPDGTGGAVLLRGAEVVDGIDTARARRPTARRDTDLARGPGNLGRVLSLSLQDNGIDLVGSTAPLALGAGNHVDVACGPRVGISMAADRQWRFWDADSRAVSAYRRSPRAPA